MFGSKRYILADQSKGLKIISAEQLWMYQDNHVKKERQIILPGDFRREVLLLVWSRIYLYMPHITSFNLGFLCYVYFYDIYVNELCDSDG